jgi:hypothetical protein
VQNYADGEHSYTAGRRRTVVLDPATGEVFCSSRSAPLTTSTMPAPSL